LLRENVTPEAANIDQRSQTEAEEVMQSTAHLSQIHKLTDEISVAMYMTNLTMVGCN